MGAGAEAAVKFPVLNTLNAFFFLVFKTGFLCVALAVWNSLCEQASPPASAS